MGNCVNCFSKKKTECQKVLKWTKSRYSSYSIDSVGTELSKVSKEDEEEDKDMEDPGPERDNNMEDTTIGLVLKLLDDAMAKTKITEVSKEDEEDNNMEDTTILFVMKLLDDLTII